MSDGMDHDLYRLFGLEPPSTPEPVQLQLPLRRRALSDGERDEHEERRARLAKPPKRVMSDAERDERDTDMLLEALARLKAEREAPAPCAPAMLPRFRRCSSPITRSWARWHRKPRV